MLAALPNYDWIVYADTDWVVQDMIFPLESFIKDWELHGKTNVSVAVPVDEPGVHVLSSFAVMIRNSAFGKRLLENWIRFAYGLCENGNFYSTPGKYDWKDSDQPGLWYALAKTHADFYRNEFPVKCDPSGKVVARRVFGPDMREYFTKHGVKLGLEGHAQLNGVPDDQPILWSVPSSNTKSGLGLQKTFGHYAKREFPHSFAFHTKLPLNERMKADVETCRRVHGCHASYGENGQFHIGCGNHS